MYSIISMDYSNYDRTVKSNLEIIGCYFIDNLYNRQYQLAKENYLTGKNGRSMTDEYISILCLYLDAIKSGGQFERIIRGISNYYTEYTTINIKSEYETINNILKQFIPKDYFVLLNAENKQIFIERILLSIVEKVVEVFIRPDNLRSIIDHHENAANVNLLKETIVNGMIIIREEYYDKFVKQLVNGGADNGMVSASRYEALENEYNNVVFQLDNSSKVVDKLKEYAKNKSAEYEAAKSAFMLVKEKLDQSKVDHEEEITKLNKYHSKILNEKNTRIESLLNELSLLQRKLNGARYSSPIKSDESDERDEKVDDNTSNELNNFINDNTIASDNDEDDEDDEEPTKVKKTNNKYMKKLNDKEDNDQEDEDGSESTDESAVSYSSDSFIVME